MKSSGGVDSAASWLVAAAGFLIQTTVVGSNRANGLLFVAFLEYNRCSREEASWPFTMPGVGVIFFAPLGGYLASKFDSKNLTFFGVLLVAMGSSACFFSTNVYYVSVFFGLVRGAGFSMCLNSVPGSINLSFDRHRTTAMGIALSGDSVGSFLFPLMVQYLLGVYMLKGTFLLLGALTLHGVLGAAFLVPTSNRRDSTGIKECELADKETQEDAKTDLQLKLVKPRRGESQWDLSVSELPVTLPVSPKEITGKRHSLPGRSDDRGSKKSFVVESNSLRLESPDHEEGKSKGPRRRSESLRSSGSRKDSFVGEFECKNENSVPTDLNEENEDEAKKPFLLNSKVSAVTEAKPNIPDRTLDFSQKQSLKNIFSARGFYLSALTQVVDMYFVSNFNLIIVDYLADKGTPLDQGLFMLTVFAVGQLVGRLGLCWITDRGYMSRPLFLSLVMNLNAGLCVFLTFMESYAVLMVCGTVLGALGGTLLPISNVLFADYLRKEDVSMAIGISISVKGLFYLTRIPLIGYFRDELGSYDHMFHFMAGMLVFAAIVWLCEEIYLRKRKPIMVT